MGSQGINRKGWSGSLHCAGEGGNISWTGAVEAAAPDARSQPMASLDDLAQPVSMPWLSFSGDCLEPRPSTGQTLATVLTSKHGRVPVWNFLPQVSRESGSRRLATGLGELFTEDEIPRASDERLLNQKWLEGSLSTEGPLGAGLRPWKLKAIPRCATLRPPSPTLIPSLPLPPLI